MIDNLKKLYNEWNQNKLVLQDFKEFIEITTPFVDMNHDYIQLFFTKEKDGTFKITDDGHIINELKMLGIDISSSTKRKSFFNTTLNIFGVKYDKFTDELYTTFHAINDYPEKQHRLIQCILKVSDMLLTSRNTVISIFTEEITNFFEENDVIYTPGANFNGVSGKSHNFDFTIPHFKNRKEKLIKAINSPSSDNYVEPLFAWIDIQNTRDNSELLIVANDTNKKLTESFTKPFENYSVEVLAWSRRYEWVEKIKIG